MKSPSLLPIVLAFASLTLNVGAAPEEKPVDGKMPPPKAPEGKWKNLLAGRLEDNWTGMSMSLQSPLISTTPNPDKAGEYVLHIARGRTGLIRSLAYFENFILELEWRHLTEAPNAGGGNGTSGNSGLLICHSAFPKPGGPYPGEGHEVQVCNLGNGTWYTSHGDIFTLPGSSSQAIPDPRFAVSHYCGHRSMPVEFRGSKTGEWNHVRITCVDGVIQQEVNGALVTSLFRATPRKGYMSFESEGGDVEFRNMRVQELAADPDLAAKHVAPLLPEEMTTDYLTERKAVDLPGGNFMVMADVNSEVPLSTLITGAGLPERKVQGRVLLSVRDGKVSVSVKGKAEVENLPFPAAGGAQLRLDAPELKVGHVLLFKPKVR
ncbi:MAG TPA: DUF1080 domain-containing protein [Verrucomicrobiales bacterium]|nr:DUF1080 domain-containing protein [Verrucomicrobiales bacterium]